MALKVAEPERSFLGRWAAKGSTDAYVRTAVRVVENLQLLAARHAQASSLEGPDFYGEEHILADLARHLRAAGEPGPQVEWLVSALTLSDFRLRPTVLEDVKAAALAPAPDQGSPTVLAPSDGESSGVEFSDCEDETGSLSHVDVRAAADLVVAAVPVPPSGFVISKAKRGKFRRLHLVPVCRLVPGVHYKDFDTWGDRLPAESDFHAVCSICLPHGRPFLEQPLEEALLGEASSSSSGEDEVVPVERVGAENAMDGPVGPPGALAPP